ncbi:MAG TPA: FAD-binding dehydrogenase, partial [Eubacteriaceae bacterium]|nr:FAD-binding dehydrogenase [Eubacteriaceae bacterium]
VEALKNKEVSESEGEDVELDVDVVVAGAGGTGLAAAASAHENGAEVLVLEKMANTGGSTALSGGGISATGSKFQEERGIEDSKESWMELWKERQATSNPDSQFPDYERVDYFMDEAIVTTEWLVDYVGHSYGDISGFGLDPVERLHFPEGGGGSVLTGNIEQFLRDEGVEIRTETEVTEIIVDDEGNAVGVLAQGPDGKVTVNAKKVILATGGYARSEEMLEKYIPEAVGTADLSAAAAGTTGDGMVMTEKLDAAVYEEPWVIGLGVATKVEGTSSLMMDWSKLYVNGNGERFTNEQIHYAIATNRILEADNPWIIIDSAEENAELVQALEAGLDTGEVVRGESVEALAEEMGVPVDTFVDTIETYNAGAQNGNDEFGKTEDFLKPVENSPFYAIKAYGKTMGTFAGVEINDNMQVLREDGSIIGNLYAGGEMANKALYNQVYMSGSAVQWALTSGRLAGEHAATNLQ